MGRTPAAAKKCFEIQRQAGQGNRYVLPFVPSLPLSFPRWMATCNGCQAKVSCQSTRLEKHCDGCADLHALGLWSLPTQMLLTKTFGKTSSSTINALIGKFFFACNVPFVAVQHDSFRDLVHALNPTYRVPTRQSLAGPILDEAWKDNRHHLKESLAGRMLTMSIDGWSTADNVPLIGIALGTDLVALVEERHDRHTADMLADLAGKMIPELQREFDCQVVSVVSDGAKNMENMRATLGARCVCSTVISFSFLFSQVPTQ